ncbi:hypothetical protein [Microbacterium sp.]|uniref:hypothetical protein n=1 Tax=Microbacterium sp. TaxID=51671 RepID=UPI0039E62744
MTEHGSRLYGLAHEGSDFDFFAVYDDDRLMRRWVEGDSDCTEVGLPRFLELAFSGSHQSVEALFSRQKFWWPAGEKWRPMLDAARVSGADVFEKYEHTIRKFCFGDFKRRRHAVRLSINLRYLRRFGRFDPHLSTSDARYASWMAEGLTGADLASRLGVLR